MLEQQRPSSFRSRSSTASSSFEAWRQACFHALGTAGSSRALPQQAAGSSNGLRHPILSKTEHSQQQQQQQQQEQANGSAWVDHPETADEQVARERCEGWKDELFRTSPMVRFMAKHLSIVSCDPLATESASSSPTASGTQVRILIAACPPDIAGGFSPAPPGSPAADSGILLCSNRMMSKTHMEDTLAHEMIHWWDHCRFHVRWDDLRHHACSEIRAASLSGDCNMSREWRRRNFGFTKQHQICARRRAVLSVMANPVCKDRAMAEQVVDDVWQSCFNDTRPFDEIY
ncbi:hypothetical protein K437DRAFT_256999 [Tilletiaria anomala UBC 951]|uniref:Mitochondrial inner membrane protease ATP23 n=1 Tax=Tilletiaria anomala (strain ATCC 24038 / CBS 436.72 / UBC 951) TaxID=1037660 RepID=A0A066W0H0_TILAU|nr:uncharacterized protein K437DRAFT_256999 [Tilletiaria anomala UBC 951]KDN44564.1 hypothetical protein K437DRAFT_256999 [Tilletiaria anomala UBC 951]